MVEVAFGAASVVLIALNAPQVVMSAWRYLPLLRSWISSWTRATPAGASA